MSLPWLPFGWLAWLWVLAAGVGAVSLAMLALAMLLPVEWEGPGRYGPFALLFPLHLLVAVPFLAGLGYLAFSSRAELAAWIFAVLTLLVLLMALLPVFAVWRAARVWQVPLSLREYLAHARHWNVGAPERERSVVYGVAKDGTELQLDVWKSGHPSSGPLRPAIVMVHGGGWTEGSRNNLPDWNRWLNRLGYEVFDVEYRLPPPVRWLDEVADVKAALGWVAAHAAEYHVDPGNISVMGGSAGANLALLAAYSSGDARLPPSTDVAAVPVRAVINCFGPTDLLLFERTAPNPHATLAAYVGGTSEAFPERYRLLSPLTHVSARTPPTLTLHGSQDRLISPEHARLLDAALERASVPHELYVLPGNDHAFDLNWGGFGTQIARAKIAAFLARHATR